MTSETNLEQRYRRRTRLFPRHWRDDNEDEIIGVLLDCAAPNQQSVPVADTLDLLTAASKVRLQTLKRAAKERASILGISVLVLGLAIGLTLVGTDGNISPEFLATSFIVVLVPGTGALYTVSSAIAGGQRRGFIAAVGSTLAIVPHMLAAMVGLSGVMQAGATAFEAVRWAGVAYLVFMGVSMIRNGGALNLDELPDQVEEPAWIVIRRGILLSALNPKLTIFFFAFLPQFLDSKPTMLDPRLLLLGAIFMVMTLAVFLAYAFACAAVRQRVLDSPSAVRVIQRAFGTLLVGFAARLALSD